MSGYVPRKLRDRSGGSRGGGRGERDAGSSKTAAGSKKKSRTGSSSKNAPNRPSPRGGAARRPSPKARVPLSAYRRFSFGAADWRRYVFHMVIAALVALVFAGVTWVGSGQSGLEMAGVFGRSTQQVTEAKNDADNAASAMLSYDYRTFEDSRANGMAFITGSYAKDYDKLMDDLKKPALDEKAVLVAEVIDVATVETDAICSPSKGSSIDGGIEFLAFVNQSVTNKNIEGTRIDKSRVAMCMAPTDEGWKVADLDAI